MPPLTLADHKGNDTIVRMLLATGVDANATDSKGRMALSFARDANKDNVIALLKEAGAKE